MFSTGAREWFDRVYACTQHDGYYECKKFATEEAATLYNNLLYKQENKNTIMPLIYVCRFTPMLFDRTILNVKLKGPVLLWTDR